MSREEHVLPEDDRRVYVAGNAQKRGPTSPAERLAFQRIGRSGEVAIRMCAECAQNGSSRSSGFARIAVMQAFAVVGWVVNPRFKPSRAHHIPRQRSAYRAHNGFWKQDRPVPRSRPASFSGCGHAAHPGTTNSGASSGAGNRWTAPLRTWASGPPR